MPNILRQETYNLDQLMQGSEVTINANCIYIIRKDNKPLYVGKSTIGVRHRIVKHMQSCDTLGMAIKRAKPWYRGWSVEIWWIDQGLLEIERQAIIQFQPSFNKTDRRY